MIVEWILSLGVQVINTLAGLINGWTPDDWFINIGDTVNAVTDKLDGLGIWVNWGLIGAALLSVWSSWTLFGNVKLARVGASHIPLVGGGGN